MKRRLTNIDYAAIYNYVMEHGHGAKSAVATNYGVSAVHVGKIVTAYRCIMNDEPIRDKSVLKLRGIINAAMEYKKQNTINSEVKDTTDKQLNSKVRFQDISDILVSLSEKVDIETYIKQCEAELLEMRDKYKQLNKNLRLAKSLLRIINE